MFSTVIVPLDGSQFAEAAIAPAASLSAHGQADLLLVRVHVRPHPGPRYGRTWDEFFRSEEDACLEKNAAVDVYDDEEAPACTSSATCASGPEADGRLYVTTCPLPEGWSAVDEATDARCGAAIDAYRSGDEGRCP